MGRWLQIDPHSFMLAAGLLYAAMPATVWVLLQRRHPRAQVELWCLSGLGFASMLVLFGLRGQVSDLLSVHLANLLGLFGGAAKVAVLRMEREQPPRLGELAGLALLCVAAIALLHELDPARRQAAASLLHGLVALGVSRASALLARERQSRSARLMAVLFAVFAAAVLLRGLVLALGPPQAVDFPPDLLLVVTMFSGLVAIVGANIGYVGLALDRAQSTAREQRHALDGLRDRQQQLEVAARTREALSSERARTTRLLAHEVRQPLHNAAVALQSAVATLARGPGAQEAAHAIEQAQAVIRRVSATLDNTVAATTLLAAQGRISTADTDLQVLMQLCLADLPNEARARVELCHLADARSARLEPSLVRLALRNLLVNATLYAGDGSPVQLRVLDSDDPLAVVFEVADQGPGIDPDLRERLFDEGARGPQPTVPGYGLGLHVVKRVARLHGGSVDWRPNQPRGSVFSLVLPQGDPG